MWRGGGGIIFMTSKGEVIGPLLGDWSTWMTSSVSLHLTHADSAKHFTRNTFP